MFRFLRIIGAGSSPPRPENLSDTSSDHYQDTADYENPSPYYFIKSNKLPRLKRSISDNDLHIFDKQAHRFPSESQTFPLEKTNRDHIVRRSRYFLNEFGGQTFDKNSVALEGLCDCESDIEPLQIPQSDFWPSQSQVSPSLPTTSNLPFPHATTSVHSNMADSREPQNQSDDAAATTTSSGPPDPLDAITTAASTSTETTNTSTHTVQTHAGPVTTSNISSNPAGPYPPPLLPSMQEQSVIQHTQAVQSNGGYAHGSNTYASASGHRGADTPRNGGGGQQACKRRNNPKIRRCQVNQTEITPIFEGYRHLPTRQ